MIATNTLPTGFKDDNGSKLADLRLLNGNYTVRFTKFFFYHHFIMMIGNASGDKK